MAQDKQAKKGMKYDDDYSNGHINLFAPTKNESRKPKSILKHTNYRTKNPPTKIQDSNASQTFQDISVFAYSSKIYRDDFTALKIESKEYLIPWNGDQSLLIDKYDCRLFLYDLDPYDSDLISDSLRNSVLTHEENEMEALCDFERYLDLVEDENQTETNPDQTDTDVKRGAAIGYVYENDNTAQHTDESNKKTVNQNEKLFLPDENLKLPTDMAHPETVKSNQLIIKTASFVAKQGLQAEILLKTKQSGNSQFNFLLHGDQLHPYYKHMISLIRECKIDPQFYLQQEAENKPSPEPMPESETDSDEDNYLHPLLSNALNRTLSVNSMTKDQQSHVNLDDSSYQNESKNAKIDSETIQEPSGNEKIMIDKLAEYVGRNGPEFEDNLRKKNDSRFEFLNSDHRFYKYYKNQIENILKKINDECEIKKSKRNRHKLHPKESKRSDEESSDSDSSHSSESKDSENEKESKKRTEKKGSKEKKRHKRHKSRHEKSSSRKRHHSSRKKHKKSSSS